MKCRFWQGLAFRHLWDLDLWTETAAAVFQKMLIPFIIQHAKNWEGPRLQICFLIRRSVLTALHRPRRIVKPQATNTCTSGKTGGGGDRRNSLLLVEGGEGNCAGSGTRKFWRQEGMQPNKSWRLGVGSKIEATSFMGHW